jgi:acetyl esterase
MTNSAAGPNVSLRGDDLDPDIRRFVREMGAAWARHPEFAAASPADQRRIADVVRAPWTCGGPEMVTVIERDLPSPAGPVRVRCYDPGPAGQKPAFIYLHGGGWTIFSLDTHDRVMREYAARANVVVIGVDYALSPEAKYPVALQQVRAVVSHLERLRNDVEFDMSRMAIGGDSAGGNLGLATCMLLRDEGLAAQVRALVLNYAVLDRWSSPEATVRFGGDGYMLSSGEMEVFWRNYLRDSRDEDDPLVCPMKADLSGLPPTFLAVPECDLLSEQSVRMAARLRDAGVPVVLRLYRGASHSFLEAVSIAPLADRALAETAGWLTSTLTEETP